MASFFVPSLTLNAIGLARTPFQERVQAPRQPYAATNVEGQIVLFEGNNFEHALEDLQGFDRIWLIFWFHKNQGWRPKVQPPRSEQKRGVFATRSPYRPNPIGLSVVRLDRIEGLTLFVRDIDLLDETPILDIKPYLPSADAFVDAKSGWVNEAAQPQSSDLAEATRAPVFEVIWSEHANNQLTWLANQNVDLRGPVSHLLSLGPYPHPYRRIRKEADGFRLAYKEWRVFFQIQHQQVFVSRVETGYRRSQLLNDTSELLVLHRAFATEFEGFLPTQQ